MISAWKRFINKPDASQDGSHSNGSNGIPPGIQKLDKELQRKFAKGVNYNMKVVIRGDAKVGKTSLFLRLKGYGYDDNYNPTENLNVTSINWNYKATDDIVKIDLWEAIDSSTRKKVNFVDLKFDNKTDSKNEQSSQPTDGNNTNNIPKTVITNTLFSMNGATRSPIPESAQQSLAELSENFDVYRNANAVLFVLDMTKLWTFKYVQAELPKVPRHIPILIVANHRDQGHHRTVSAEQVRAFIDGLDRSPCDGIVMYTEASMKNGFGLRLIEKFFNVPFLKLQESSLVKQLELNRCDHVATLEELQIMQDSTNREYEQYLELQTIRRRQQADAMSPVNIGLRPLDEATRDQIRFAAVSSANIDVNANVNSIESNNAQFKQRSEAQMMASQNFVNDRMASIVIGAKCPLPESRTIQVGAIQSSNNLDESAAQPDSSNDSDDESEAPRANPLVADYQSDLDSDDQVDSKSKAARQENGKDSE